MIRDAGLDQLAAVRGECGGPTFLILAHKPRVAPHVGSENGGEATLDTFFGHALRSLPDSAERLIVWVACDRVYRG